MTTPVTWVLEGVEGVNLDPLDHKADVVWLPVHVKVCDVDEDQDGEDGLDEDEEGDELVVHTYRSVDAIDRLDVPCHHLK